VNFPIITYIAFACKMMPGQMQAFVEQLPSG